jgi:hypothetical protein
MAPTCERRSPQERPAAWRSVAWTCRAGWGAGSLWFTRAGVSSRPVLRDGAGGHAVESAGPAVAGVTPVLTARCGRDSQCSQRSSHCSRYPQYSAGSIPGQRSGRYRSCGSRCHLHRSGAGHGAQCGGHTPAPSHRRSAARPYRSECGRAALASLRTVCRKVRPSAAIRQLSVRRVFARARAIRHPPDRRGDADDSGRVYARRPAHLASRAGKARNRPKTALYRETSGTASVGGIKKGRRANATNPRPNPASPNTKLASARMPAPASHVRLT